MGSKHVSLALLSWLKVNYSLPVAIATAAAATVKPFFFSKSPPYSYQKANRTKPEEGRYAQKQWQERKEKAIQKKKEREEVCVCVYVNVCMLMCVC